MPVFASGRIIAWTANIAHNSDLGGMAPGSLTGEATEIFQEGLRPPAIKIISKSEPICPVMEIETDFRLGRRSWPRSTRLGVRHQRALAG